MTHRRVFLSRLAAALGGSLFLSGATGLGRSHRLVARYRPLEGMPVVLDNRRGERVSAVVERVSDVSVTGEAGWDSVSILLRTQAHGIPIQDVYEVEGIDARKMSLLLVPICSKDGQGRLEAVISRRAPRW